MTLAPEAPPAVAAVRGAVEVKPPVNSRADGLRSADPAAYGVPRGREEDWRFSPLPLLRDLLAGEATAEHLSWTTDLPNGVTLTTAQSGNPVLRRAVLPVDRASAVAVAGSGGAAVLSIAPDTVLDRPAMLGLAGSGGRVHGHLVIDIGAHAAGTVIIEHTGTAVYAESVSVLVGDGAHVKVVHLHSWDADAIHAAHIGIRVGRDATVESTHVSLGGRVVRIVETVEYDGPGGDVRLSGLYVAGDEQHLEHRLFVDHAHPRCRSDVMYKGALLGPTARTVWVGDVLIRAAAEGTQTYELNRNLLLSAGARADSVPNLEIETGQIEGAGHASATGRFDDEQLFYLQARGITPEDARRLVARGFFADIIARIGVPEVAERLTADIDARLTIIERSQS